MECHTQVLMNMIRAEVCADMPDVTEFLTLEEEEQKKLIKLAGHHSVAQLVGDALGRNPASAGLPVTQMLFKSTLLALNQVTKNDKTRKEIGCFFENEKIRFLPLKGARIRPFYPQPWMRTSCDIDILVPEDQVEQAAQLLVQKMNFRLDQRNFHDISLYAPSGVHLELHFSLLENQQPMDSVLEQVWKYSRPVSAGSMEYIQSDEFFMFHLMAHIVHHVFFGGCGIRPFVDLFVLKDQIQYDEEKVKQLCAEAGILTFWNNAWKLVDVWFGGEKHTDATRRLESYILGGGSFGTVQNYVAVGNTRNGGKMKFLCSRIWIPTSVLEISYPVLKKNPWLMPVCQIKRWFGLLRPGKRSEVERQLAAVRQKDQVTAANIELMLRENGLL